MASQIFALGSSILFHFYLFIRTIHLICWAAWHSLRWQLKKYVEHIMNIPKFKLTGSSDLGCLKFTLRLPRSSKCELADSEFRWEIYSLGKTCIFLIEVKHIIYKLGVYQQRNSRASRASRFIDLGIFFCQSSKSQKKLSKKLVA